MRQLQPSLGIWCDQLCIDQQDLAEKAVSIGLMDGVYRSARIVCMVIDDIEFSEQEPDYLRAYASQFASHLPENPYQDDGEEDVRRNEMVIPPTLLRHPILKELYSRLASAQWIPARVVFS